MTFKLITIPADLPAELHERFATYVLDLLADGLDRQAALSLARRMCQFDACFASLERFPRVAAEPLSN